MIRAALRSRADESEDAFLFRRRASRHFQYAVENPIVEGVHDLFLVREAAGVLQRRAQADLLPLADVVVLGGGNVKKMTRLPKGVEKGDNRNAYLGGVRLWEIDRKTGKPRWQIL